MRDNPLALKRRRLAHPLVPCDLQELPEEEEMPEVSRIYEGTHLKFTESYGPHAIKHDVDIGFSSIVIYEPEKKRLTVKGPHANMNYQEIYSIEIQVKP
jgi:hypothetical protein